jgi:hypothetical protein
MDSKILFASALIIATGASADPPPPSAVIAPSPGVDATPIQLTVPWSGPTGEGVSFGVEEGGWTGLFGSGLRIHVPIIRYFGFTLRGAWISNGSNPVGTPTGYVGGRLDLVGRSPVFLNLLRLYGGGGVDLFSAAGPGIDHTARWGGGGHFGFEFFLNKYSSFYLEVGGRGAFSDGSMPGGQTIVAGMNLYPFSS